MDDELEKKPFIDNETFSKNFHKFLKNTREVNGTGSTESMNHDINELAKEFLSQRLGIRDISLK